MDQIPIAVNLKDWNNGHVQQLDKIAASRDLSYSLYGIGV